MKKLKLLLLTLSISIGFKQPEPVDGRIIFLSDGRKVNVPQKPSKLAISYSIVHTEIIDYTSWFVYLRTRIDNNNSELVRKWYL